MPPAGQRRKGSLAGQDGTFAAALQSSGKQPLKVPGIPAGQFARCS